MGQTTGTIHIKWVRSGIALPRRQRKMVASLGLRRLNQVVERPDTPNVRGIVAKVPHLLQVVPAPERPAWAAVPEYVITAPASLPQPPQDKPKAVREAPAEQKGIREAVPAEAKEEKPEAAEAEAAPPRKRATSAKAGETKKKATSAAAKKPTAKGEEDKPRKRKASEEKAAKSAKKGKE